MMKAKHVRTGIRGEKYVATMIENLGYEVHYPDGDFCGDYCIFDPLTGEAIRLEVKTANRGAKGYQFCTYRAGKTNCQDSDVVALVFIEKRTLTVKFIAANHLRHIKLLNISKHPKDYTGKYSKLWFDNLSDTGEIS